MQSNTPQTDDYEIQFVQTSQQTFHRTPYEWQSAVGSAFLRDYYNNKYQKILLVRPTGGGKSLVFNTISVCIKGVTICISPLLSLGADQSRKVIQAAHDDRSVSSFHLDEMHQSSVKALLENLKVLSPTQTVFIFTSPQAIVNRNDDLREYLIDNKLIKFIVIDEIHLVNHFGKTFRNEFEILKHKLFTHVKEYTPMMFITATCSANICE